MRKINYPLIVSDFDGTLVKKDGTISEENRRAIDEYIACGGKFAISTGRMTSGILHRARELGLKGLISCCQGAIIVDIESGKTIMEGRLPLKSTIAACKKMEKMDLHIQVYDSWEYYSNKDDEALKSYERGVGKKAVLVLDKPLSQFVAETSLRSYKVLAMVKHEENEKVLAALTAENFEGCTTTRSSRSLVEVINQNFSKGTAVQFIAKHYGISLEKTIAVGDQQNDIPMIEVAGLGIAVQNADERLKAVADYVTEATFNENAIAEIIYKFGFTE